MAPLLRQRAHEGMPCTRHIRHVCYMSAVTQASCALSPHHLAVKSPVKGEHNVSGSPARPSCSIWAWAPPAARASWQRNARRQEPPRWAHIAHSESCVRLGPRRQPGRAKQQHGRLRLGLRVGLRLAGGAREQPVHRRRRPRQPRRVVLGARRARWRGAVRLAARRRPAAAAVRPSPPRLSWVGLGSCRVACQASQNEDQVCLADEFMCLKA